MKSILLGVNLGESQTTVAQHYFVARFGLFWFVGGLEKDRKQVISSLLVLNSQSLQSISCSYKEWVKNFNTQNHTHRLHKNASCFKTECVHFLTWHCSLFWTLMYFRLHLIMKAQLRGKKQQPNKQKNSSGTIYINLYLISIN